MGNSLIQRTDTSMTHTGFHRRTGITLIALTATTAALALSACSPSSPANEAETANTAQGASVLLPEGEGSTQYPLTLETPFGHTVLDKCPERVAVVSAVGVDTESLLALDAVPVFAVAKYDGEDPWLPKDLWEQVEFTEQGDAGEEISAEAIAASEPDLIVKLQAYETIDQDRFNQLSRVAPVFYTDAEQTTWQDVLTSLGETQDLRDAAASMIAEFDDRVEAIKADNPDFAGKTISLVNVYSREYGASYETLPETDTAAIFESLGFKLPENAYKFPEDGYGEIRDEMVGLIDADLVLVGILGDSGAYFTDQPLLKQVPAVAEGRAVVTEGDEAHDFTRGLTRAGIWGKLWALDTFEDCANQALN